MTSSLEPCPFCGDEVHGYIGFDLSEDVRYMDVECDCGLDFYAESRIIRGGCHDEAAEVAELESRWNTRAAVTPEQFSFAVHNGEAWARVRTCEMSLHSEPLHLKRWLCSECGRLTTMISYKPEHCCWCGAKVVD